MITIKDQPYKIRPSVGANVKTIAGVFGLFVLAMGMSFLLTRFDAAADITKLTADNKNLEEQIDGIVSDTSSTATSESTTNTLGYDLNRVNTDTTNFQSFVSTYFDFDDAESNESATESARSYFADENDAVFEDGGLIGSLASNTGSDGTVYDELSAYDLSISSSACDVYFIQALDNGNYQYAAHVTVDVTLSGSSTAEIPVMFFYEMTADNKITNLTADVATGSMAD